MTDRKVLEQEQKTAASRYCIRQIKNSGTHHGKPFVFLHLKADNPKYLEEREREVVWHCVVHVYAHTHTHRRAARGDSSLKWAI